MKLSCLLAGLILCLDMLFLSVAGYAADFLGATVMDQETPSFAWRTGINGARPTVKSVKRDSLAAEVGLKAEDIILNADEKQIYNSVELENISSTIKTITVLRNLEWVTLSMAPIKAKAKDNSRLSQTSSYIDPPKSPTLRIETGMHMAALTRIDVDKSGRWLVSASHDKTVRVWDLESASQSIDKRLQPIRVIRPPLGKNQDGALYAVAISSDSNFVAAGGMTKLENTSGTNLYLFSRHDGRMLGSVSNLPNAINHLAFSPNGQYLAAVLGGKNGIRVFDVGSEGLASNQTNVSLKLIFQDDAYGDSSYAIHFSADNKHMATSCDDGYVRVYELQPLYSSKSREVRKITLIAKKKPPGGSEPTSVAFAPDGFKIAVGFADSARVDILSSRDLSFLYAANSSSAVNSRFYALAWSEEGQSLYAGGVNIQRNSGGEFNAIRRWDDSGRGQFSDLQSDAPDTIMDLTPMPDGGVVFGAAYPAIGKIDRDGIRHLLVWAAIIDFRSSKFKLSQDGTSFQLISDADKQNNVTFSLLNRSTKQTQRFSPLFLADTSSLPINNWYDSVNPSLNSKPLKLNPSERSRSLAIAPDKSSFLLGGDQALHRFDSNGIEQWKVAVPSIIRSVNIAINGKVATAALGDGTIRWYDYATGRELLAFFLYPDKEHWVLWTPEGFFDHSPGGEELIGWHLNQGKDKEALFFPASKLYKEFYRPDLVTASFEGKDISAYARAIDINKVLSATNLPPNVRFTSKISSSDKPDITLSGEICDAGGGIGDVTLYLDGMPVSVDAIGRGLKVVGKTKEGCQSFEKLITLQNGENAISLMAYNKANTIESNRDSITITHKDKTVRKPTLHVLTVAVNSYRDGDLRLKYSIPDAQALSSLVKEKTGGLFEKVAVHTLFDGDVTREKLKDKFAEVGKATRREDVFLLFVAGHGITNRQDGAYYFLPHDFRYTDEASVMKQGVSEDDFKRYLTSIQATKSLLLLDTCNSGSFAEAVASRGMVEKTAVNKLVRAVGRATIVASSKDQVALEGYEGHGVFTWTAMEGLKGKAAGTNGQITVNTLATFIEENLPKITYKKWGYEQIPQKSLIGMDFPIGIQQP